MNAIATVVSVTGEAFARNSEGELRPIGPGDVVFEGEVVITAEGASVELAIEGGNVLSVGQFEQVALTADLVQGAPGAEESSIAEEDIAALLEALESGVDINEVLEETAAGGVAEESGHSFVRLARLVEALPEQQAADSEFAVASLVDLESPVSEAFELSDETGIATATVATLTLSATSATVVEGEPVTFTAVLDTPAVTDMSITLSNGSVITILTGELSGSVSVATENNPYITDEAISLSVAGTTGGGFTTVNIPTVPTSVTITDSIDISNITLSASSSVAEGEAITYTATLDNPAGTDLSVTLSNGQTITITAGAVTGSVAVAASNDAYIGGDSVSVAMVSTTGGNLESLVVDPSSAQTTITDDIDVTNVTLSAANTVATGDAISYTATLDNPAATAVTVTLDNGAVISIAVGQVSGSVDVASGAAGAVSASIASATGGNFESLVVDATAVVVNVISVNDFAPTFDAAAGSTLIENTAVAGDTVATFTASDLDGDAITYSITSGNAAGYFTILDNTTGVVTLTAIGQAAIEDDTLNLSDQIIGVTANDGVNNSAEASVTIEITHVNDNAPTIDTSAGSTQVENTAVDGDTVATFTASELDGDAITYSITSGNTAGYFEILDNTTGVVTLTANGEIAIENDTLNLGDQIIGVTANDGVNDSVEATATIAITHVNDNAPTVDTATGSTQVENTAVAGDTVATFTASDLDGDAITYSITSGNAAGYFAILDNTTGVVTLTAIGEAAIENDTLNLGDQIIGVTANDGVNDSAEAQATIEITHVNDNAPTIDTSAGSTQVENTAVAGDTVATFTASDLDGDAITYSITSGNTAGYFEILDNTTGVVTLTAIGQTAIENDTLNLGDQIIGVTANDGVNNSAEASVTIEITHVNDNAPTIDTSAGSTQVENTAVDGDTVATFTASELDGDAITYSITSGNTAGYFEILDNTTGVVTLTAIGQTAIENDTLNLGDQIIGVTANDGVNNSAEASVTIEITHVNDNAPTIDTSAGSTQVENTAVDGDTVATFTASDLDGDAITYSITSGNAAGYFEILDNTTGVVTLTAIGQTAIENDTLNLGDQIIGVTANDGVNDSAEASVTIEITHVNDNAPTIDTSAGSTQVENTAVDGDTVATFTASDLDGDAVTYSITSGNTAGYFTILDNTTGVVTLTADGQTAIEDDVLNLADQVIGVTANDGVNDSVEATTTIAITHVNDNAPTIDTSAGSTQVENTAVAGDTVATFTASDLDGDAITYSITSGNTAGYFEILDNTTGVVTLTANGEIAIENDTLNLGDQIIGVTANDGVNDSVEATATIAITHVNDNAPTVDTATGSTQVENAAVAGDTVATFTASDLDGDAITYSITSGNAAGYFEILDNTTGVVTLTADGEIAIENDTLNLGDQIIGVTANDGVNDSVEATATIAITHVNDNAPTVDTATGSTQVENAAVAGDTVATFTASDLDGDAITYSITSGNAAGYFEILDNTTGVVTLTATGQTAIENDTLNLGDQIIRVTANDGINDSAEATATIAITYVNDNAPTVDTATGSTQVENT
ncbi:retention module-containing protein, partial [Dasania marina]|uniref:retention module-containing protein n=1 Tax=Dasania marina TaxID=471499 RepID=UPI0030D888FE